MKPELIVVEGEEALAKKAVEMILDSEPSVVALSGGETPRMTYQLIAGADYDFSNVDFFLTDERCVPTDHPFSNWKMVSETLLDKVGARGHRVMTELPPEAAAAAYEKEVKDMGPFDLIFLGLGTDGHTASLFPGAGPGSPGRYVDTAWSKESGMWRVTMTLRAINESRIGIFLVAGGSKAEPLRRLLKGDDIPAAKVSTTERLIIIADRAAAGEAAA